VQRALGFVRLRLTMAAQVYGGSMSFVVGAFLRSFSSLKLESFCSAGDTVASGLSMVFNNIRISGSQAVTSTEKSAFPAPSYPFQMQIHAQVNFVHSFRTQVLLQAPTYVVLCDYSRAGSVLT